MVVAGWVVILGIAWLACIIWVAIDARKHSIIPVFWPLATLISGPLGLVAYGIVRELVSKKTTN
jgi:hypothetical protein